ncbi:MAG: phosphoribosylglycinamide formyltransferase [Vicingaceae bacterium]
MINIAIFASGTGSNAIRLQEHFSKLNAGVEVKLLVCNKADAPVVHRMKALNVPVLILTNKELEAGDTLLGKLIEHNIDWIVLAGFLRKIPDNLVAAYSNRIINIHPSLLPKYGGKGMYGMRVHQAVIENKERESGISIHLVNEKYDDGKILFQKSCVVHPEDQAEEVARKVQALEHEYFPQVVEETIKNNLK